MKPTLKHFHDLALEYLKPVFKLGFDLDNEEFLNLDRNSEFLPDMPFVKLILINKEFEREIDFALYLNGIVLCNIRNLTTYAELKYEDYYKTKGKDIYTSFYSAVNFSSEQKFSIYFKFLVTSLLEDLGDVVSGNDWIDLPFDWQGQK